MERRDNVLHVENDPTQNILLYLRAGPGSFHVGHTYMYMPVFGVGAAVAVVIGAVVGGATAVVVVVVVGIGVVANFFLASPNILL